MMYIPAAVYLQQNVNTDLQQYILQEKSPEHPGDGLDISTSKFLQARLLFRKSKMLYCSIPPLMFQLVKQLVNSICKRQVICRYIKGSRNNIAILFPKNTNFPSWKVFPFILYHVKKSIETLKLQNKVLKRHRQVLYLSTDVRIYVCGT